jgi:hypothetical protein
MKAEVLNERNPYHVLGIPSFANPRQIRSAYLKRIQVLKPYRFDKSTHFTQWQTVNEILDELNEAYARLRPHVKMRYVREEPIAADNALAVKEIEVPLESISHRENAELAIQTFQRLTAELDHQEAQRIFLKLVAARGFDESQIIPHVISSHVFGLPASNPINSDGIKTRTNRLRE